MNERLRQLMVQADYPAPEIALRAQKLAELIVKECMTVCADNACRAGGLNTQVGEDLYLAADLIKEHFGVEE
jgi:hypothetical protein